MRVSFGSRSWYIDYVVIGVASVERGVEQQREQGGSRDTRIVVERPSVLEYG